MPEARPAATTAEAVLAQAHPFEKFVEDNFKKVLLGVLLLALAFVAIGVSRHFARETELEAAERFTSASTIEDCDIVIQKYPGTAAAGNALLVKAELQWTAGKKEASVEALKEFLKSHAKHPLQPQAQLALASKQEALGDKAAAGQTYDALIKSHPDSELAPAAQIRLGDLAWADGKVAEAKKIFDNLPRTYPGKMEAFMDQVRQRTEIMNAGLPEKEVDGPPPAPKPALDPHANIEQMLKEQIQKGKGDPHIPLPGINTPMPAPKIDLAPPPAPKLPATPPASSPPPATPAPVPSPSTPQPEPPKPGSN